MDEVVSCEKLLELCQELLPHCQLWFKDELAKKMHRRQRSNIINMESIKNNTKTSNWKEFQCLAIDCGGTKLTCSLVEFKNGEEVKILAQNTKLIPKHEFSKGSQVIVFNIKNRHNKIYESLGKVIYGYFIF